MVFPNVSKGYLTKGLKPTHILTNVKFLFFQLFLIRRHYYQYYAFEWLPTSKALGPSIGGKKHSINL